ncbi:hypothetical protein COOONC_11733 [Cooperia oncophora]
MDDKRSSSSDATSYHALNDYRHCADDNARVVCAGNVTEPRTCDEFWNRTDGVKIIYINGKQINVYCQYGTTGAYTVIQSRGSLDDTTFNRKLEEYRSSFGIPGKGNNFWLGLDNMVALTSQGNYDLLIELCCSGTNSIQFYKNFTVG